MQMLQKNPHSEPEEGYLKEYLNARATVTKILKKELTSAFSPVDHPGVKQRLKTYGDLIRTFEAEFGIRYRNHIIA